MTGILLSSNNFIESQVTVIRNTATVATQKIEKRSVLSLKETSNSWVVGGRHVLWSVLSGGFKFHFECLKLFVNDATDFMVHQAEQKSQNVFHAFADDAVDIFLSNVDNACSRKQGPGLNALATAPCRTSAANDSSPGPRLCVQTKPTASIMSRYS